ncbi:MAG: RlpA-like double-psi beta-barrel domain-containing protein [Myxococcota bacterium]
MIRRLPSHSLVAPLALCGALLGFGLAEAAGPKRLRGRASSRTATASPWVDGVKFTLYGTGDGGACDMGILERSNLPFAGYVAAGDTLWDGGQGCGRFIEIRGGSGPTCTAAIDGAPRVVMIADRCPECDAQHLDLTTDVWAQLTESSGCIIEDAEYRTVPGRWKDDVSLSFGSGSHAHWARVLVQHHNWPIESVALRGAGSNTWHPLTRASNQGFYTGFLGSGLALPVAVRLRNQQGETLVAPRAITSFSGEHDLGWQFASDYGMTLKRSKSSTAHQYLATVRGTSAAIQSVQLRGAGQAKWSPKIKLAGGVQLTFPLGKQLRTPISLKLNSERGESVVAVDAITELVGLGTEPIRAQFACTQKVESTCDDGLDNDCDGKVDADDPNC